MKAKIYGLIIAGILIFCILPIYSLQASYVTFEDYPDVDPPPVEDYLGFKGYYQFGSNSTGIQIIDTDSVNFPVETKSYEVTLEGSHLSSKQTINQNTFMTGPQIFINGNDAQYVESAFKFVTNPSDPENFQDFTVSMMGGPELNQSGYRASLYRNFGDGSHTYLNLKYWGTGWEDFSQTEITTFEPSADTWFTLNLSVIDVGGYAKLTATLNNGSGIESAVWQTDGDNDPYGQSSYYAQISGAQFGVEQLNNDIPNGNDIVYRMDNLKVNPEPATCLMFISSLLGLGWKMKRRLRK